MPSEIVAKPKSNGHGVQLHETMERPMREYDDEIDLADYCIVIWKWRWVIVAAVLLTAVVMTVHHFRIELDYTAKSHIIPSEDVSALSDILFERKGSDDYLKDLKKISVMRMVLVEKIPSAAGGRLDTMSVAEYIGADNLKGSLDALYGMTKFEQSVWGAISISVTARDSFSASAIASLFASGLAKTYREVRESALDEEISAAVESMKKTEDKIRRLEDRITSFRIDRRWMLDDAVPLELESLEKDRRSGLTELDGFRTRRDKLIAESRRAPPTFDTVLPEPGDCSSSRDGSSLWHRVWPVSVAALLGGAFLAFLLEYIHKTATRSSANGQERR